MFHSRKTNNRLKKEKVRLSHSCMMTKHACMHAHSRARTHHFLFLMPILFSTRYRYVPMPEKNMAMEIRIKGLNFIIVFFKKKKGKEEEEILRIQTLALRTD